MPAWLTSDWPLVGLSVLVMLGALAATCAVLGVVLAIVTGGGLSSVIDGATTGIYLSFAAFGAKMVVSSGPDLPGIRLGFQFLALPLGALGVAATWLALRFAGSRLANDRSTLLAFAGKLVLTFGIVVGVLASVLSIGDVNQPNGFSARVSGGEAWIYSTLIVGISAMVFLWLRGVAILPAHRPLPGRELLPYAIDGAKAFGLLAVGMTPIAFVATIIAVDHASERLGALFGMLAVGLTMGIVGAAYAMGAAIDLIGGHTSLLHFGFPPGSDAGAAPLPFFILVLVAPAILAWVVYRRMEQDRPATEQDAIKIGFCTAIAFGLTAWFAALLSRVTLFAELGKSDGEVVRTALLAKPSPGAVLALALLWGLVGGLGMALFWARQQGAGWRIPEATYAGGGNGGYVTDVEAADQPWPVADQACRTCGEEIVPGGRFCARCGTPISASG